jgi:hypothetical protein
MKCKICKSDIVQYTTRKSVKVVTKAFELLRDPNAPSMRPSETRHMHHGNPTYKYGICKYNHYNQLEQIKVDWQHCTICAKNNVTLAQKRKHLVIKARKKKMEVPSFLRHELDIFEAKMTHRLEQKITAEVSKVLDAIKLQRSRTPPPPSRKYIAEQAHQATLAHLKQYTPEPSDDEGGNERERDNENENVDVPAIPPESPRMSPRIYTKVTNIE